jgi:hypothetical protein
VRGVRGAPVFLAVLVAGSVIPTAAASAPGAPHRGGPGQQQRFGVRLVDVPVSEVGNPRGLRYIIDYLRPGAVIRRRVLVVNQGKRTARFSVYPDAAKIGDGAFIGAPGRTRNELTGWIRLSRSSLTLRPHASAMVTATIKVPRVATRGEHYGVIWAQQVTRPRKHHGGSIREIARVGIRIYLAIGPGGVLPTDFAITTPSTQLGKDGRPVVLARVRNTGGRAVDLGGSLYLSGGPGGTNAGPFQPSQVVSLAPRQTGTVTFVVPADLPAGPWQAKATLVSGRDSRSATAVIELPGAERPRSLTLPMAAGIAIMAVLLAVWARYLRRRVAPAHTTP